MKIAKTLLVVCSLLVLTTGAVSACTYECQGTFSCKRCVDTGNFTANTCMNIGSCGCQYTLNTCGGFAAAGQAQDEIAAMVAPVEQGAVCSAVDGAAVQF